MIKNSSGLLARVYQGKVRYFKFKFTVLPLGLGTGPCIFTKVMRPLVKHGRGRAYRIVFFR